jgi:hypothetical protein
LRTDAISWAHSLFLTLTLTLTLTGAISWAHSLFLRIRQSIAKFQSMEELFTTEQGKSVNKRFVQVSKEMRHYQQALFAEWRESVNQVRSLFDFDFGARCLAAPNPACFFLSFFYSPA